METDQKNISTAQDWGKKIAEEILVVVLASICLEIDLDEKQIPMIEVWERLNLIVAEVERRELAGVVVRQIFVVVEFVEVQISVAVEN